MRQRKAPNQRVLIGVSGIPGSGKTTLAEAVVSRINTLHKKLNGNPTESPATVIPMDGFHLYRSELAAMPDPATAIHRRGAAFTFAADRFHELIQDLAELVNKGSGVVYAPSFDHAKKDPVERDIEISSNASIVVIEGLYLSLDREPWRSAAGLMDELWFITVDREIARSRLIKRHVESGIVPDAEAAAHRVSSTDLLNADDILENRLPAQEVISPPEQN